MQLGEIAKANPGVAIGSYPFFDPQHGANTNVVLRAGNAQTLVGRGDAGASAASTIKGCLSLSTPDYESGGQEFESLRARQ